MKLKYILFALSMCFLAGVSCSDDDENKVQVNPVQNLKAISGHNEIKLQWNNPENENLSYIEISYIYEGNNETVKYEPKGETSSEFTIIIPKEYEKVIYKFALTAYDTNGNKSDTSSIKGKAYSFDDLDAYLDNILNSIAVESVLNGGVKFVWTNEYMLDCILEVSYPIDEEQTETINFDLLSAIQEGYIESGILGEKIFVLQVIMNKEGIKSKQKELIYIPAFRPELPKANWNIHSYSTQKATSGDGSAKCLIDGTNTTMWSSSIADSSQWIIVDLGGRTIIEKIGLQRKSNDDSHHGWDMNFYIGDDPDNNNWQFTLEYESSSKTKVWPFNTEFNRTIEPTQWYFTPPSEKIIGRYIKFECVRIASKSYFHMGELYVCGTFQE